METRTLRFDGELVAHATVSDPFHCQRVVTDHVFVFRSPTGYELLSLERTERYEGDVVVGAHAHVDWTPLPDVTALRQFIASIWPSGDVWTQLLENGRDHDPALRAAWVPEEMRRELDRSSAYDKSLATTSGYLHGRTLDAAGRDADGWRERATAMVGSLLSDRGWSVRPGPDLSPDVQPGELLSASTEIVGTLWATHHNHEVAVIVRVDDAGEIYPRLAEPCELLDPPKLGHSAPNDLPDEYRAHERGEPPVRLDVALDELLRNGLDCAGPGSGLEL